MTDGDMATEIAKELAKQLPVKQAYDDVAAPAAAETGQFLGDLAKTLRLVFVPIQLAAAYQDRVRAFIDRSIRAVPEANLIAPPPQILGPVLEGVRYEVEGTPIDEMFAALLSTSMDKNRHAAAHPAFAGIIKNLSADEARILKTLATGPLKQITSSKLDRERNLFEPAVFEVLATPDGLDFPENARVYFEHLNQLGLIELNATQGSQGIMDGQIQYPNGRSEFRRAPA
jgi:hypothetical protein